MLRQGAKNCFRTWPKNIHKIKLQAYLILKNIVVGIPILTIWKTNWKLQRQHKTRTLVCFI